MKEHVLIKSYQNGITLILSDEIPFEELRKEIAYKFHESGKFFGTAKMALSIEGRDVTGGEEMQIVETIQENCDLNITCLIGRDEETNQNYLRALQEMEQKVSGDNSEGQFYRGTLKNRQILETESSIVILGDVYPGSAVISARNIIILGGLYGEAYAGGNGGEGHYIVALEMEPEKLKIGDFKYRTHDKAGKWSIKPKIQPKIAYIKNQRVLMEPLTKELLGSF